MGNFGVDAPKNVLNWVVESRRGASNNKLIQNLTQRAQRRGGAERVGSNISRIGVNQNPNEIVEKENGDLFYGSPRNVIN